MFMGSWELYNVSIGGCNKKKLLIYVGWRIFKNIFIIKLFIYVKDWMVDFIISVYICIKYFNIYFIIIN